MSWKPEVEEIERLRALAAEHGGAEPVARHRAAGRRPIRERIAALVDPGTFREYGAVAGAAERDAEGRLLGFRPANYVLGVAHVGGRPCVVGGEDFTQRGGSPSPAGLRKSVYAEDLALRQRMPLVRFLEGGGGSVTGAGGGARSSDPGPPLHAPPRFRSIDRVLATVPVVSIAVGPVAGFPAARLAASHLSLMTRNARVMIGGPALVARALGQEPTQEELGGPAVHARSGVADRVARDEDEAVEWVRRFLAYLPGHVFELPPRGPGGDDPARCEEALLTLVPRRRRQVYDARKLVEAVVDRSSWLELAPAYGRSQITGLARLDGWPVGVLANDGRFYAGAMTADGALKVRRFVDLCDTFHLPIVSFVDEPGFMIGPEAERRGTIRHGAAALCAVQQSTVPWASVIVRKAFGVAAAAHFGPEGLVLAWPSAETGALPVEGGIAVAFRREIAAAPDPAARRAELEAAWARRSSPFPRAEAFGFHDLVDPRRTRPLLCDWVARSQVLLREHLGPRSYTYRP